MQQEDGLLDAEVVTLLRDTVLPGTANSSRRGSSRAGVDVSVPAPRLAAVNSLLQRGANLVLGQTGGETKAANQREAFVRACIKALVDAEPEGGSSKAGRGTSGRVAEARTAEGAWDGGGSEDTAEGGAERSGPPSPTSVEPLLVNCEATLRRFQAAGSSKSGSQTAMGGEVLFVLTTVDALVSPRHRHVAARLYPLLVDCIPAASDGRPEILTALVGVLKRYEHLLR